MTVSIKDFLQLGAIVKIDDINFFIGWGKRKWLQKPNFSPAFFFPDFFLKNEKAWFTHEHYAVVTKEELMGHLKNTDQKNTVLEKADKELFLDHFLDLKTYFKQKKLIKAVPFTYEKIQFNGDIEEHLYSLLSKDADQLFIYGFWDENEGMLGATPELFFDYDQEKELITTMALAGTAKTKEDLFHPKMMKEHAFVIEGIKEALSSFGKVIIQDTSPIKFPKFFHLLTPIKLRIHASSFDLLNLIKALHPTPALGTFPKKEGVSWLEKIEKQIPRNRFGAPCGIVYAEGKKARMVVAIRNMQWQKNEAKIFAGCGVIESSTFEKEWQEIELKLQQIKELLYL